MSPTKQRTILFYTVMGIFAVAAIWALFLYFTSATLTITTNSASNTILVHENSPTKRNIELNQNKNQASVQVEAGNYTVTIQNKATSTSQIVNLKMGERKSIILNLETAELGVTTPSVVTSLGAGNITAASDHLTFIDKNNPNRPLYTVNIANRTSLLDGGHNYTSVKWADPSFGIGLVTFGSVKYGLVKISGQTITNITLPFTATKAITYAISPNRTWYISDGSIVYKANGDGSFTKIYTTNDTVRVESASNNAVLLTHLAKNSIRVDSLISLHSDGTKYQIEGELYESVWSPLGDKLVISSDDDTGIYDSTLHSLSPLPRGNVISPVWLDDTTLFYVIGSDVWRYDTTSKKASIVTSVDSSVGSFSSITPDNSGNYLYISVYRSGFTQPTFGLDRISLKGKPLLNTTTAGRLNIIFPHVDSICTINFMNFTSISVLISQTATNQSCYATAKNAITDSRILDASVISKLNYQRIQ